MPRRAQRPIKPENMNEEELEEAFKNALWQIENNFKPAKRAPSPTIIRPSSSVRYFEAASKDAAVTMQPISEMNQLKVTVFKNETFEMEESRRASPEGRESDESLDFDKSLTTQPAHKPGFKGALQQNPYRIYRVANGPKERSESQFKRPPRA